MQEMMDALPDAPEMTLVGLVEHFRSLEVDNLPRNQLTRRYVDSVLLQRVGFLFPGEEDATAIMVATNLLGNHPSYYRVFLYNRKTHVQVECRLIKDTDVVVLVRAKTVDNPRMS